MECIKVRERMKETSFKLYDGTCLTGLLNGWIVAACLLFLNINPSRAQSDTSSYKYHADLPLVELGFLRKAMETQGKKDWLSTSDGWNLPRSYETLSMQQALALTKTLHSTNYYANNVFWEKVLPRQKNRLLNRFASNVS